MTQRIKGRGPAFMFDDITQRFPPVITEQTGTVANAENLLDPQLSPKAEFTDASSVTIVWPLTEDVAVDGYIIAGIDDPLSGLNVIAFNTTGFRTNVQATQFSEQIAIIRFDQRVIFGTSVPPEVRIERDNVAAGKMSVGYIMPFKIIRDPSLSDASFDFSFSDTSQKERSQSGQTFSGAGVPFRTLRVQSAPTNSRTMFGIPEIGDSVAFLTANPNTVGTVTEIDSFSGIGRNWAMGPNASLTWPGVLVAGREYILRSFVFMTSGGASTGFFVASTEISRDDGAVEFIGPVGGDLVISTSGSPNGQIIDVLNVSELKQTGDPSTSIIAAVAASRASLPIAVMLSPDDPVWTRDTTIFGIPEWGVSQRTEAADDRFVFELRVTESL